MHSKSPSVMAFCLVCLGILAKNMPKHLAGYYLLNSYFASINSSSSVPKIVVTFFAPSVPLVITMGIIPGPGFHLLYCFFRFCHVITLVHSSCLLLFKNASAFLLRDARHAMHDIFLLRISAILPEAISDGD